MIEGALWQYVRAREGYNYAGAPDYYALVSAMSSRPIREAYQHWFVQSKDSPQKTIGQQRPNPYHLPRPDLFARSGGAGQLPPRGADLRLSGTRHKLVRHGRVRADGQAA